MLFNVIICVIFFLVNPGSFGSHQNGVVAQQPTSLAASNQTHANRTAEHGQTHSADSEAHLPRPLSTPKLGANSTAAERAAAPQAVHVAPPVDPPASSSANLHHVSVDVEPSDTDNVILDVTHTAGHHKLEAAKWNPTFAAIVAAICITTAVGGYVMLMAWRKIEMDRYGNRQMLINEDDFGDIQDEDMRHFEMQDLRSVRIAISPSHQKTPP